MAKILLVDDEKDLACVIQDWLAYDGHTVDLCHTGLDGWKHIKTNDYELTILDWDLPELTGIEILKKFRAEGGTTPVILLTGHTSVDDKELGLDSGANDYLTKPFHMKELTARVRAALRGQPQAPPPPKPLGSGNELVLARAGLAGTSLASRYEFLDVIGEGGVAIVFKAKHPQLDKIVAIKMLKSSDFDDEVTARFEREARVVSKLEHPNIVTIYDFGLTERKQPYMVMEWINGQDLDAMLAEQPDGLPLPKALSILSAVSDGLSHAHANSILHRDIKPSNIILKQTDNDAVLPKLLDFGLAKLAGWSARKEAALTQDLHIVGTPIYMSPEMVLGRPVDERSDIYSFGCLAFELVTGQTPFTGETAGEMAMRRLDWPPLTFAEVQPAKKYPAELQQFVARALEREPEKRYQTMIEVRDELSRIILKAKESPSAWSLLRQLFPF